MNKNIIIGVAVGAALLGVVALTLFLLSEQQDVRSRADNEQPLVIPTQAPLPPATAQDATCAVPAVVQNVLVEFPSCPGDLCDFTKAGCSWSSVAGASNYQLVVTEVETATAVKNEQVAASVTSTIFPVNANKTYKCDVSAINSCGTSGPAGSHALLCEVDALVEVPTPTPVPPKNACGQPCTSNDTCNAGLICAMGASGQGYCSIPAFEGACKASPNEQSCCTAPTPQPTATPAPTLPPTGGIASSAIVGAGVGLMLILGVVLLFL